MVSIVEIDESLIGKKKGNTIAEPVTKNFCFFGMVERGTRNCVMQFVDRRDKDILIPIIKRYIIPGSKIFSDMHTPRTSVEFKSNEGCCTNYIEGLWGLAKLRI